MSEVCMMRHLRLPSTRARAICGYDAAYTAFNIMDRLADVNCLDCLAIVNSMHSTPPTTGSSRYGQART